MMENRSSLPKVLVITIAWLVIGFLIAPMFVTFPISLTSERYLSMPDGEISFRHYQTLVEDSAWISAFMDSLIVATGTVVVSLTIGTLAAIGLWQIGGRPAQMLRILPLLPLIVPPVVSALALSRAWVMLRMLDTYPAVIISHSILALPFVFMTVSASLESVDKRIVQAARSLGSGPFRSVFGIVIPNVKAGLFTGGLFAFFVSWDEIVVTLFITGRNVFTLPRKIWSDLRDSIDPAIATLSSLMIAVTIVVAAIYLTNTLLKQRKTPQE